MEKKIHVPFTLAELKHLAKLLQIGLLAGAFQDSWHLFMHLLNYCQLRIGPRELRLHEESDISCGINCITGVSFAQSLEAQVTHVFYSTFCKIDNDDSNKMDRREFGSQTLFSDRLRSRTCAEMKKAAIKIRSTNANSGNAIVLYVLTPSLATKFIKKSLKKLNKK